MSLSILIVGSDRKEDGIPTRVAGDALLWGLEQRGIRWQVHMPQAAPMPDLRPYDAILCWSYRIYRTPDYFHGATEIEARARELGKPVINSVKKSRSRHSDFLDTWREHGVPCAKCQRFKDFEDIRLDYPLLLRRDGVHQGEDLFHVATPEDAERVIRDRQADDTRENLDLAIEFVDVRDEHGRYNKYRSLVIGEQIIPLHALVSEHWLVNYHNAQFCGDAKAASYGETFLREGEQNTAELLAAARLTGSDVLALDYAKRSDGCYVFWEANRHFLMLEDHEETQTTDAYVQATGHTGGRDRVFETMGSALADLVVERAQSR